MREPDRCVLLEDLNELVAAWVAAQAPQGTKPAPGTVLSQLPAGCNSVNLKGVDYFDCAGTYLRPAIQSNNVVYIVSQP